MHGSALHAVHFQHDEAVIEQQGVARFHVAGQLFVVQPHTGLVPGFGAGGVQHKRRAIDQLYFPVGKLADPDLGALQVSHDGHFGAGSLGGVADHVRAVGVVLRGAV